MFCYVSRSPPLEAIVSFVLPNGRAELIGAGPSFHIIIIVENPDLTTVFCMMEFLIFVKSRTSFLLHTFKSERTRFICSLLLHRSQRRVLRSHKRVLNALARLEPPSSKRYGMVSKCILSSSLQRILEELMTSRSSKHDK